MTHEIHFESPSVWRKVDREFLAHIYKGEKTFEMAAEFEIYFLNSVPICMNDQRQPSYLNKVRQTSCLFWQTIKCRWQSTDSFAC